MKCKTCNMNMLFITDIIVDATFDNWSKIDSVKSRKLYQCERCKKIEIS